MNKTIAMFLIFPVMALVLFISLILEAVFGHDVETKFAQWGPVGWVCDLFERYF